VAASSIEPCSTSVVAEVSRTTTNFMSPRQGKHPPCQAERKRFSPFRHLPIRNRTDQSLEGLRPFTDAEDVRELLVHRCRSQHFEPRKRRVYEVLFAELLKLGAPSRPGVMKHWLKAEATSAAVSLSAFWRTPHFFSGNQTRKTLLFVVVPLNSSYLILGRLPSPFSGSRKPKRLAR